MKAQVAERVDADGDSPVESRSAIKCGWKYGDRTPNKSPNHEGYHAGFKSLPCAFLPLYDSKEPEFIEFFREHEAEFVEETF